MMNCELETKILMTDSAIPARLHWNLHRHFYKIDKDGYYRVPNPDRK